MCKLPKRLFSWKLWLIGRVRLEYPQKKHSLFFRHDCPWPTRTRYSIFYIDINFFSLIDIITFFTYACTYRFTLRTYLHKAVHIHLWLTLLVRTYCYCAISLLMCLIRSRYTSFRSILYEYFINYNVAVADMQWSIKQKINCCKLLLLLFWDF